MSLKGPTGSLKSATVLDAGNHARLLHTAVSLVGGVGHQSQHILCRPALHLPTPGSQQCYQASLRSCPLDDPTPFALAAIGLSCVESSGKVEQLCKPVQDYLQDHDSNVFSDSMLPCQDASILELLGPHNLICEKADKTPTVSRSVAAGQPRHEKPIMLSAADIISPKIPGKLLLAGKYAKKLGLCQCVTPARRYRKQLVSQAVAASCFCHACVYFNIRPLEELK